MSAPNCHREERSDERPPSVDIFIHLLSLFGIRYSNLNSQYIYLLICNSFEHISVFNNININGLVIAFSVMIGTLVGYIVLLRFVIGGKPQAGLPFLCSGALLGYFLSTFFLYGRFFV